MTPASLLLAAAIASATLPSQSPSQPPPDPRIQAVDYDPARVVTLKGRARTATQVQFAPDERILHAALGDAAGWEVAAEGPVLFVRPRPGAAPTNLLVTAQGPEGLRHYAFDLKLGPAGAPFVLRFRYPDPAATKDAQEARTISQALDRAVLEGARNFAYSAQGASALQPSEVSDNGRFTLLRFPAGQPLPAIYQVEASGTESLAPFDVRGEVVVVHLVARELRLRRGREVLCLYNAHADPYGSDPGTGAASQAVERTIRPGR